MWYFTNTFLNMDISLNILTKCLKRSLCIVHYHFEGTVSQNFYLGLKPIFHQNANYLASGVGVGQCTRRQYFGLPNTKYTNMLVYFALADTNFLRRPCTFHFLCVDFFALGSKRKPHFQWNIGCVGSLAFGLCVGHVHFMR